MRDHLMPEPTTTAATAAAAGGFAAKTLGIAGLAGVAAGAVAIALTLPRSKPEFFCRVVVTVLTSIFMGPLVVEVLGLQGYSINSQVGIYFMSGVPSWLVWSYIVHQLEKAQNKSPAQIAKDIRNLRGGK